MELKITKLEAARRQLETAVRLYFNEADPVSVHTLACAAHEILAKLKEKRGDPPMIISDHLIKEPYKAEFRKIMREAKNFFKHANQDPDGTIDFNPKINDNFLLDACEAYELLTGEKIPHFIIYRGWFNYKYPHILNLPNRALIENRFGNNKMEYYTTMLAASAKLT